MPPFLAAIGVRLIAAAAVMAVLAALWWRMDAAIYRAEIAEAKVTDLGQRVIQADAAVNQAAVVNQAMRDALVRQNGEIQSAKAMVAKLEADARAARMRLAADQEAARRDDTARRARLDKPTAAELNAVLRGVVGAM